MSWASKRVTTRLEDSTYCLMAIFGVNVPKLYGERAPGIYEASGGDHKELQ